MTIEQLIVGYLEVSEGCTRTAVMPPPSACSTTVDVAYGIAQLHLLTILIVLVFVTLMIKLTMIALNPNGEGGH